MEIIPSPQFKSRKKVYKLLRFSITKTYTHSSDKEMGKILLRLEG